MCTETYIRPIPQPTDPAAAQIEGGPAWLALLRNGAARVALGMTAVHPLTRRRVTQLRTKRSRYGTNYLFFSPDSPLEVQVPGGVTAVPAVSLLWMPPGVPYSLYCSGPEVQGMLYRLRFDVENDSVLHAPWPEFRIFRECEWYPELYRNISGERDAHDGYTDEYIRSMLVQLSVRLFRSEADTVDERAGISPLRMRHIRSYLLKNIRKRPSPADLARVAGLSPAYFAKVFTRDTGTSPRQWITEQRIRYGAELLRDSSMNVSETAEWLGYADLRLFIRQFKSVLGTTPAAYRRGKI